MTYPFGFLVWRFAAHASHSGTMRTSCLLWIAAGVIVPAAMIAVALVLVYGVKLATGAP